MTFYYKNTILFSTLVIRLIPILFFYYLALVMSYGIYIAVAILSIEAIIEILYMYKMGYAKIHSGILERNRFFFKKTVRIEDVHKIYVYNDEWTFKTHEREIRIDLKTIRESQKETLTQMLEDLKGKVINRKKAI